MDASTAVETSAAVEAPAAVEASAAVEAPAVESVAETDATPASEPSVVEAAPAASSSPDARPAAPDEGVDLSSTESAVGRLSEPSPAITTESIPSPDPPRKVTLRVAGATDVGRIRDHNEDNFVLADLTHETRGVDAVGPVIDVGPRGLLLAVCDGMGGALAGEVASQMAVDVIHAIMQESSSPDDADEFAQTLVTAVQEAGARIFLAAKTNRNQHGMGTTSTVAGVYGQTLFVGQVGDSRAYLFRGGRLRQVTKDQSLVSKLIEAGRLTEEQAESYEHAHIILQALGTADAVSVDLSFVDLRRGDALLVCSDGLSGLATHDQLEEALTELDDPAACCERLIEAANEAGGHDNVTVVVARFEGDLPEPSPDDEPVGYHAFVLSQPVESPVVGDGAAALKLPALPPPGSDVKKAHSLPPSRSEAPVAGEDDASQRSSDGDPDVPPKLPVASPAGGFGWFIAVLVAVVLTFVAWRATRPAAPAPPAPSAEAAPAVTPLTPNGGAEPTLVPAPTWNDAQVVDAGIVPNDGPSRD